MPHCEPPGIGDGANHGGWKVCKETPVEGVDRGSPRGGTTGLRFFLPPLLTKRTR